jgi:hypothetical protein
MNKPLEDFVSNDTKEFKWKIGQIIASSLSGFIAGIVVAIIFMVTIFDLTLKGNNLGF